MTSPSVLDTFWKMHGTGNDFVVLFDADDRIELSPESVQRLCDRHFGVGADGVIRIAPGAKNAFFMDYRNSDGSLAEMCGNGVRVVGKYLGDRGLVEDEFTLDTRAGEKTVVMQRGAGGLVSSVTVDMGVPRIDEPVVQTVNTGDAAFELTSVSVGNPHAIIFGDGVDRKYLHTHGPVLEHHQRFPEGVNVTFAHITSADHITVKVWERGSGETLSCGTAACATVAAAVVRGLVPEQVTVHVPGGQLQIVWKPGSSLLMTGPATEVFPAPFDPDAWGVVIH